MPIVDIRKDPEKLIMTVTAQFAAPVARVWAASARALLGSAGMAGEV